MRVLDEACTRLAGVITMLRPAPAPSPMLSLRTQSALVTTLQDVLTTFRSIAPETPMLTLDEACIRLDTIIDDLNQKHRPYRVSHFPKTVTGLKAIRDTFRSMLPRSDADHCYEAWLLALQLTSPGAPHIVVAADIYCPAGEAVACDETMRWTAPAGDHGIGAAAVAQWNTVDNGMAGASVALAEGRGDTIIAHYLESHATRLRTCFDSLGVDALCDCGKPRDLRTCSWVAKEIAERADSCAQRNGDNCTCCTRCHINCAADI